MTDSISLSLSGDVERPACLTLTELRPAMDAELVADFHGQAEDERVLLALEHEGAASPRRAG